ncbi:tyrosine-type recombinase/integrase [Spirillospora sp. NPDC127200]
MRPRRAAARTAVSTVTPPAVRKAARSADTSAPNGRARTTASATRTAARKGRVASRYSGAARAGGSPSWCARPNFCPSSASTTHASRPSGNARGRTGVGSSASATGVPWTERKAWKALLQRAGVHDGRLHDARHTAGSLLAAQGVHIQVIQEILGHARVTTTERYTVVLEGLVQDAGARLGGALWGDQAG